MKKALAQVLVFLLVFSVLPAAYADEVLTFSHEGGLYENSFYLELSTNIQGARIYYTLDGSDPTVYSISYTAPIEIKKIEPMSGDVKSTITNGANVGARPYFSGTVVRAKVFDQNGNALTKTITNTYFVADDIFNMFKMPILNLTFEPSDFIGPKGMYTNPYTEYTPQCFMEYYEADGTLGFKHSAEVKISGHASKGARKKSLRLNFTKGKYENDKKLLGYDLFPEAKKNYYDDSKVEEHAKITFRVSDWENSTIRESLTEKISDVLRPDTMSTVSTAVFINGEFWGVYEMREQFDNNFVATHYDGISKSDVVQLDFDWDTANSGYPSDHPLYRVSYSEGPDGEEEKYYNEFMELYNLITGGTIHTAESYNRLKQMVDIDNLIDYIIIYNFFDNIDWPGNNIKMWKTTNEYDESAPYGKDGRWRFIIHDFDIAYSNIYQNTFDYFSTSPSNTDARRPRWAINMITSLFNNEEFRNQFAARYFTYLNTTFQSQRTVPVLYSLVSRLENGIGKDFYRWNLHGGSVTNSVNNWKSGAVGYLENFLTIRPDLVKDHLKNWYNKRFSLNLTGLSSIKFYNEDLKGYFSIDGAEITQNRYGDLAKGFTSDYLSSLPVNIKYVPGNEKIFDHLEVRDKTRNLVFEVNSTTYSFVPNGEYEITPVFKEDPLIIETLEPQMDGEGRVISAISVTNNSDEDMEFDIYCAVYDGENRLIDVVSYKNNVLEDEKTREFNFELDTKGYDGKVYVKTFMWDNLLEPVINVIEYEM